MPKSRKRKKLQVPVQSGSTRTRSVKPKGQTADEKMPATKTNQAGPHFRFGDTCINDEWQTTLRSWKEIEDIFQKFKSKRVWMPFYFDGQCAEHLRSIGFTDVVHEPNVDFFEKLKDRTFLDTVDIIWDNPPYTGPGMKEKVLTALAATGKPFAMLLPSSVMFSQFVRDILDMSKVQVIVLRKVFVSKGKKNSQPVPFKYMIWLCYGTDFERDLMFPEPAPDSNAANA